VGRHDGGEDVGATPSSPSLWELIDERAASTPGGLLAVDDRDRSMTFAQLRDASVSLAGRLGAAGVRPGTPVSWILPTWLEALTLIGALARLGAVQNPILPVHREREVGFCVAQTAASHLVVPTRWKGFDFVAMANAVAARNPGLQVVSVDRDAGFDLPATTAPLPPEPPAGGVRWHFYTSGTTADPKGARHTDASVTAAGVGFNLSVELGPDDRVGVVFPYTHVGGIAFLAGAMMAGYGQILVEAFDPGPSIAVLRRHGVTIAGAGAYFWNAYLDAQRAQPDQVLFPRLRALAGGGSAKPAGLHERVKRELGGVGIVSGYGLTECPSAVLCSIRDTDDKLASSDGRPVPGAEMRVADRDDRPCPAGTEGEIQLRGTMLFSGYVDEALDAAAWTADGWLHTGDLGTIDADGYLDVTGRIKEIIIRKGENVSIGEVESVLATHPAIRDVAVVGVPDVERGEMAFALVVPEDPAAPPTLEDLGAHCRARGLAVYKIPERLEIAEHIPRNATGKVVRHELRARLIAGSVPPAEEEPA